MKRASLFVILLVLVSLCLVAFKRQAGSVLKQSRSERGGGVITIRELQRAPFTVAGFLGLGDVIHRCDYTPHPGWPVVSSISLIGESYFPSKMVIEWTERDSARVSLDNEAVFYLGNGVWQLKQTSPKGNEVAKMNAVEAKVSDSITQADASNQKVQVANEGGRREPLIEISHFTAVSSTADSKGNTLAQRIQKELEGSIPGSVETQAKFASLWNASSPASFTKPVPSSSDPDVAAGRRLPAEADAAIMRDSALVEAMESGQSPLSVAGEAELDGVLTQLVLATSATISGFASLPEVLSVRSNALPPTVGDVASLMAVKQALREQKLSSHGATTIEDWRPLAAAKNPVYRYLALLAVAHTESRDEPTPAGHDSKNRSANASKELLELYQTYLNETDPVLLKQVIQSIGNLGTPAARQKLESLRGNPSFSSGGRLREALQLAIQDCDAMIRFAEGK